MTRALSWVVTVLALGAGACDPSGPELTGFSCAWGAVCPPGSSCDPGCAGEDCGNPCYANVTCDPKSNGAGCPAGDACDASGFCLPAKTCSAHTDCDTPELCVNEGANRMSLGVCMDVSATPAASCDDCAFPWFCQNGACALHCQAGDATFTMGAQSSRCPGALRCVDEFCVP